MRAIKTVFVLLNTVVHFDTLYDVSSPVSGPQNILFPRAQ